MKTKCNNCKTELNRRPCRMKNGNNYCNASCQMKYEYKNKKRDEFKITKKANIKYIKLLKNTNWQHFFKERKKLGIQKIIKENGTIFTINGLNKLKDRKGEKNPMYGKKSWNHKDNGFLKSRYLKRPDWTKIKKNVLIRDDYICQSCCLNNEESKIKFNNQPLQVHHKIPYRICREHKINNLITLCCSCHSKETQQETKIYYGEV